MIKYRLVKYSIENIRETAKKAIELLLLEKASATDNASKQLMVPNPQWMAAVFADYNKVVFGGMLKTPRFSTKCEGNEWGCYYPGSGKFGMVNRFTMKKPGTLCLNGALKRTKEEWIGVMLHEMCHMYVFQNGFSKYKDAHGNEFMQVAKFVNRKVKRYGVQVLVVDDGEVIEADGNEEYAEYTNINGRKSTRKTANGSQQQSGQIVVCVITRDGEGPKYWIAPLKKNEIKTAQSAINNAEDIASYRFFIVFSDKLANNAQTNPKVLGGFGGDTYKDAVVRFCSYYGEWDYGKLNLNNMKPVQ